MFRCSARRGVCFFSGAGGRGPVVAPGLSLLVPTWPGLGEPWGLCDADDAYREYDNSEKDAPHKENI